MHSRDYRFRAQFMAGPGCATPVSRIAGDHFDLPWTQDALSSAFPLVLGRAKELDVRLWSASTYHPGATRGAGAIKVVHAVVLDSDCADVGSLDRVTEHLKRNGFAFATYTSWSHHAAMKVHETGVAGPFDAFRVVLPCGRDVLPEEYAAVVAAVFSTGVVPADPGRYGIEAAGKLVTLPNGKTRPAKKRGWDPTCDQFSRHWFEPGCPHEMAEHAGFEVHPGRCLDVDRLIAVGAQTSPVRARRSYTDEAPSSGARAQHARIAHALARAGHALDCDNPEVNARATCPHCADPSPSLMVRASGERVLLHCHAGCTAAQVLAAVGLHPRELYSETARAAKRAETTARAARLGLDDILPELPATPQSLQSELAKLTAKLGLDAPLPPPPVLPTVDLVAALAKFQKA